MKKNKEQKINPNEVIFGTTTAKDLDNLIFGMLSVRVHNNMVIPPQYRNGNWLYSQEFSEYEAKKFGFDLDDSEGYNYDI